MFLIRQALPHDLDDLYSLARQTYFINLPPDREIIAAKIEQSIASFRRLAGPIRRRERTPKPRAGVSHAPRAHRSGSSSGSSGLRDLTGHGDLFLFVLEDLDQNGRPSRTRPGSARRSAGGNGGVIGTSQVIAHMGGPGHPRYFMALDTVANQSRSLGIGWTHMVGRMGKDETGPTEIGGLILNHAFRGHPARLGRLLSFVRFHLIGLYRTHFADRIIAEMLGPITRTGYNPFYEKFTRHFVTRAFADVYRFSQTSREFLETLMPKGEIYLSILDPEVANAAGEVGDDTRSARRMLERLGFEYHHRIDPLDGGPHLEARTASLELVKTTRRLTSIDSGAAAQAKRPADMLVSTLDSQGRFTALQTTGALVGSRARIDPRAAQSLDSDGIITRGLTPLDE